MEYEVQANAFRDPLRCPINLNRVQNKSDAMDKIKQGAHDAAENARDAAHHAGDKLKDAGQEVKDESP